MAGETDIWCLDCGVSAPQFIGKNASVFLNDADVRSDLVTFLLEHETTAHQIHRLVFLKSSDVDFDSWPLGRIVSPEVRSEMDT